MDTCRNGHPWISSNLYMPHDRPPQCKICRADRARELRKRRKEGESADPRHPMTGRKKVEVGEGWPKFYFPIGVHYELVTNRAYR